MDFHRGDLSSLAVLRSRVGIRNSAIDPLPVLLADVIRTTRGESSAEGCPSMGRWMMTPWILRDRAGSLRESRTCSPVRKV